MKKEPEINNKLKENYRKNQADSENATLGAIIGGMLLLLGLIITFIKPQMGILMLALSVFPICEVYRGTISISTRKITEDPLYVNQEELLDQVSENSKKLKLIKKIKLIDLLVIILLIIIIVITN